MKHFFRLGALLVLGLTLGACAPSSSSNAPSGAGFPVTLEHKFGSTTLEKAPVRVVTVGLVDQDAFVALGVVPVGTREWYGNVPGALFPWAKSKAGEAPLPEVLTYELDFEKIAALNPDVIVALYSGVTQEEYDTLSKIAPTVAQPKEFKDWGVPWTVVTRTVGDILGKAAEAEGLIAGVEAQYAAVRQAHPEFAGRKAAILSTWGWPDTVYAYASEDPRIRFLAALGFEPLAEVDTLAGKEFGASVSRERLNLFDLDAVIWLTSNAEDEARVRQDPVWSKLAVAQGRTLYLPEGGDVYNALNFASVLSLPYALEGLVPQLAALETQ